MEAGGDAEIVNAWFRREGGTRDDSIFTNAEEVCIIVMIKYSRFVPSLFFTFGLRMPNENTVSYGNQQDISSWVSAPGYWEIEIRFPKESLIDGHFYFSCGLTRDSEWGHTIHNLPRCLEFYVASSFQHAMEL